MPIFNAPLFAVDEKEMLRYAGLPPSGKNFPHEEIRAALREAAALAEPRGIWQPVSYDAETGRLGGNAGLVLEGNAIRRHLSRSPSAAVLAVTAGSAIEKESDAAFKKGNYVRGLLLDAAATAIAETLADELDAFIQKDALRSGQKTIWRFSPGYGDWPVTQQSALCRLICAEEIGIRVTDHSMLTPRKSVTAVIGLTSCARPPRAIKKCTACTLTNCPFRTICNE